MAINYLNSIDLNRNELQDAQLIRSQVENQPNDAAVGGTPVEGQLYFNTTDDVLKVYANGSWVEVGGGVISLTAGTYLTNSGTAENPTINHDATSRTDTSSTATPGYGATFNVVDSVTSNATGHVTAINVKTVELPASENTTYDLESLQVGSDVAVNLVGTDPNSLDTVTLVAGTDITLTDDGSNNITIDAANPDQTVTLTGEVTGSGTTSITTTVADNVLDIDNFTAATIVIESEGIAGNDNDTTLPTSAAVKAYVDDSIVGGLVYQGGYDAATNTPDLDTSPSASIKKGWTYTVTADGLFFTEQVRVGDVIIAETNAPTTLADWTTVQNNIDLADASTVGIGNVAAGTGISVAYSAGTATVTNTDTNSSNTATGTINAGDLTGTVTHNFGTIDVMVQAYLDNATDNYPTVFCDITRANNAATATITAAQADDIIILVQKIG